MWLEVIEVVNDDGDNNRMMMIEFKTKRRKWAVMK